jgi:hypothetical protein
MAVRQGHFHGHSALDRTDIHPGLIVCPRKLPGERLGGAPTEARHRLQKSCEPVRIGIQRCEEVLPAFGLILRLARTQRLGEPSPKRVQALVDHLQEAANIGRFGAIQEEVGLRCVGVPRAAPL